jgi:hypothetical protein
MLMITGDLELFKWGNAALHMLNVPFRGRHEKPKMKRRESEGGVVSGTVLESEDEFATRTNLKINT